MGHRPLTQRERETEPPEDAMDTYSGFRETYSYEETNIMGESRTVHLNGTKERDYNIMDGVNNLLYGLVARGDSRLLKSQKDFVDKLLRKAGRRGALGLDSIQFAKLLFKVKFYGGTYK
jgi:hypothetical protein